VIKVPRPCTYNAGRLRKAGIASRGDNDENSFVKRDSESRKFCDEDEMRSHSCRKLIN